MPRSDKSSTDDFAVPVVALVDKSGNVTHVSTAVDVTNLVYGQGYKPRDHDTVEAAYAALTEGGVTPAPQTVEEAVQASTDTKTPSQH